MTAKFPVLFLVGFVVVMAVGPHVLVEARYLPTRGNDDKLNRLKEMLTDLIENNVQHQPSLEMDRPYMDSMGDYIRFRPQEYSIPEKTIMELFNPTASHHQRPRS